MECIVTYATGMYLQLSKISSEIQILNSGYLSSEHYMSKDKRTHCYFLKPKGPQGKKFEKHWLI